MARSQSPQADTPIAAALTRRALFLEYLTLYWNVVGTFVVIVAALRSRSIALTGFAIDSLIEVFASVIVVWQLLGRRAAHRRTLRLMGTAFLLLALLILLIAAEALARGLRPYPSPTGSLWLLATVIVMVLLGWGKSATARRLDSQVLAIEAHVTRIEAALAAVVLIGLLLNWGLGWWWGDPLAALAIASYALVKALRAWRA